MDLIWTGLRHLAGGARRGSPARAGWGAALAAAGLIRRATRPKRELLYARTLKKGEGLRIRLVGEAEDLEVEA